MNENLNLVELLKNCPKSTVFYSPLLGECEFDHVSPNYVYVMNCGIGRMFNNNGTFAYGGIISKEPMLYPSYKERDWSKFKIMQPKFNPKTLQPFDKVLARDTDNGEWSAMLFSHINNRGWIKASGYTWKQIIPYNEETKHLVSTTEEAPEFYRFWED